MYTEISVDKIHPHPRNPRKNLGDLTELTESIRVNGIMQNLTVVPWPAANWGEGITAELYEDQYTVVIGHRRLAAAKEAGLVTVPCAIVEMDEKTQVGAMLLENIQRSDLTLLEQADGFQMMIDLGESAKSISRKTGFSEATVRRRVKLLKELDREMLQETQERLISLEDYEKLYKIKNREKRAQAFRAIGTRNFEWKVSTEINRQEREECVAKIMEILARFATEESAEAYQKTRKAWELSLWTASENDVAKAEELSKEFDANEKYYYTMQFSAVHIYTKGMRPQSEAEKEIEAQKKERKARQARIADAFAQAYELRLEFVRNFRATKGRELGLVEKMAAYALLRGHHVDSYVMRDLFDVEKPFRESWRTNGEGETMDEFSERLLADGIGNLNANLLFAAAYVRMEDKKATCRDYNNRYEPNKALSRLYGHLTAVGYEMSSEEVALVDGTHEAYVRENVE
ncbi:MAG: ParB/RepB/Spo0J family partition protein [Oscillospiraceae bacterium]|jgi:ParB family chromosome partitioning protein|nr:ParB/RepB/Spo0J family partition protein [Oscillospiraceae bacterium]